MKFDPEKYHLKSSSLFDFLTQKEMEVVMNSLTRKEFKKGQVLFKEGSYSRGVYIVKKGKIKIYQTNAEGKESIVYLYRKGDYFGYRPLLADEPHPVSAAAVDPVVVSFIPREIFNKVLGGSNNLAKKLLAVMSKEFSVWVNKITLFSSCAVKERVAISLLIFDKIYRIEGTKNKHTNISINRNDFASYVGTAKENLVRILRVFKDEKIITTKRTSIIVLKPQALMELLPGA